MAYPLGSNELSTLRSSSHWHCDLYKVSRLGGGPPLRFSTLDRDLPHGGFVYVPTAGERYDEEIGASLASGDTQIVGALSPSTITPVDVQRGVYNDARVDQYKVDWRRPDKKPYLHRVWWIDELTHNGRAWTATLSSSARFLQSKRGVVYNSTCGAVLGDDRCRKVVVKFSGTVGDVIDPTLEFESDLTSVATGRLSLGSITWDTGNNRGTVTRILANASTDGAVQLAVPTRFPIRTGDTFTAREGCDGLATTCKNVHDNLANYRGNERQKNAKQLILSRGTVG
jgi:uncharacterized phage protein (TIGR02218 family)